jgi:hypothetical protein
MKDTGMDAQATFSCRFTQSDLSPIAQPTNLPHRLAQQLPPGSDRIPAVQVLAEAQPVAELARQHEFSRKFLYEQADTAHDALTHAFNPESKDEDVLFRLPVTMAWLRQMVLRLVEIGHAPYRAVVELFSDLFD